MPLDAFAQEVKNEGGSVVTSKLNKVKDKLTWKKKKDKSNLEDSKSQKFSSNGSLLSQNGLKPALAVEADAQHKTVGGEHSCCEGKLQQLQQLQPHPEDAPIFAISASGGDFHGSFDHKDGREGSLADKGKSDRPATALS
jgi:hypothetical protein